MDMNMKEAFIIFNLSNNKYLHFKVGSGGSTDIIADAYLTIFQDEADIVCKRAKGRLPGNWIVRQITIRIDS